MSWRWIVLIAICAALVATYGVLMRDRSAEETSTGQPQQPGYYVKDATIIDTDEQGAPQLRLMASMIEQNPADDSINLQDVKIDYQSAPEQTWLLTAAQAYVPPDSRVAELRGNVVIQPQETAAPNGPMVLHTDSLHVDLEKNIASTRDEVQIEIGQHRLSARGFKADLKQQHVWLESKVHGSLKFK